MRAIAKLGLAGWESLLELFFPLQCLGCGQEAEMICSACFRAYLAEPVEVTGLNPNLTPGMPVWAQGEYRGAYRQGILAGKHDRQRDWTPLWKAVGRAWAGFLMRQSKLQALGAAPLELWVVSAPASAQKPWSVPDQLAKALTETLREGGIQARCLPVLRFRPGAESQGGKSYWQRLQARAGSMEVAAEVAAPLSSYLEHYPGRIEMLLVDDVITSGATINEMRRALENIGGKYFSVICFCFASTGRAGKTL